jgi:hypothetical protein
MHGVSRLDCDFSTGTCPDCGAKGPPHVNRNCPVKFARAGRIRKIPLRGPGSTLSKLLREIGVRVSCSACAEWESKMNDWGIEGCRDHRPEIIQRLKQAAKEADWQTTFAALRGLVGASWWSMIDPWGSIVDESIRRAEQSPPAQT